jgi:hypothetical protein
MQCAPFPPSLQFPYLGPLHPLGRIQRRAHNCHRVTAATFYVLKRDRTLHEPPPIAHQLSLSSPRSCKNPARPGSESISGQVYQPRRKKKVVISCWVTGLRLLNGSPRLGWTSTKRSTPTMQKLRLKQLQVTPEGEDEDNAAETEKELDVKMKEFEDRRLFLVNDVLIKSPVYFIILLFLPTKTICTPRWPRRTPRRSDDHSPESNNFAKFYEEGRTNGMAEPRQCTQNP